MTRPHLSVRASRVGGAVVVSASGEIDLATAANLTGTVDGELGSREVDRLVIDLLDVSFMDSSGLAVLVAARQANPGLHIGLVVGAGMVENLLHTTALDEMFTIYPSVTEALG